MEESLKNLSKLIEQGEWENAWELALKEYKFKGENEETLNLIRVIGVLSANRIETLKLLMPDDENIGNYTTNSLIGLRLLLSANTLAFLGGSSIARSFLKHLRIESPIDFELAGSIYYNCADFKHAEICYQKAFERVKGKKSFEEYHSLFWFYQTSLLMQEKWEQSLELLKNTEVSNSPKSQLWASLCRLWAFWLKGDFENVKIEQANLTVINFAPNSKSHGFLASLNIIIDSSSQDKIKFLENVELLWEQIVFNARNKKSAVFRDIFNLVLIETKASHQLPELQKKLVCIYPGIDELRSFMGVKQLFSNFDEKMKKQYQLLIFPESDEYCYKSQFRIKIPLELKLVEYLIRAGDLGINSVQLFSLLYDNEPFSYHKFDGRLRQLLYRMNSKFDINYQYNSKNDTYRFDKATLQSVAVLFTEKKTPLLFLSYQHFTRSNVEEFYAIKRSGANLIISSWLDQGHIQKIGPGNKTVYKVMAGHI